MWSTREEMTQERSLKFDSNGSGMQMAFLGTGRGSMLAPRWAPCFLDGSVTLSVVPACRQAPRWHLKRHQGRGPAADRHDMVHMHILQQWVRDVGGLPADSSAGNGRGAVQLTASLRAQLQPAMPSLQQEHPCGANVWAWVVEVDEVQGIGPAAADMLVGWASARQCPAVQAP